MSFPFIIADDMDDIVILSAPFVAGVALAAGIVGGAPAGWLPAQMAGCLAGPAAVFGAVLAGAIGFAARKDGRKAEFVLLFFLLGTFCGFAGSGLPLCESPAFAAYARGRFCALVDSVDFAHEGTAPLLKAVLCGDRSALSRTTAQVFRSAGAAHILALSGLHLGIIYLLAGRLLLVLGKSRAGAIARSIVLVALCGCYAVITGASPSLVRAFIFICLAEIASLSPGRRRRNANILCTALMLQLCFNPRVITSVGFQLSYLAMAGIFSIFPRLQAWYPASANAGAASGREGATAAAGLGRVASGRVAAAVGRLLLRWDPMRRMWEAMALTVSCQIFTAPLVWARFHSFPKYFLLTNLLALPLTWVMVVSAVLTLILFAAFPGVWLTQMAVRLTDATAHLLIRCLEIIASM